MLVRLRGSEADCFKMEYDAVDGEYLMTWMCLCDVVTLGEADGTATKDTPPNARRLA